MDEKLMKIYEAAFKYTVLRDVLLNGADLNYRKEGLQFDDNSVSAVLKSIAPEFYEARLKALKETDDDSDH